MAKQGFKNQWIAISQIGKFKDSEGVERNLDEDFLKKVIVNTLPHEAPAVIGHPKDNTPAFGWAAALRLKDGVLEAQFADTDDDFEQMVEQGKFRKRSASFYLNPPSLRHVGFLGAMPPALKGLRDIQFADGESVTVEISFSEENQTMKDEEVDKVAESFVDKVKNLFKPDDPAPSIVTPQSAANFSEADAQKMIDAAVNKATETMTTDFNAKLAAKDEVINSLRESVNSQTATGKRAEIDRFVESIPAEKGKYFLKRAGIADFMESIAEEDKADAISFSEGETEYKFSRLEWFKNLINAQKNYVEFGEKFGALDTGKVEIEPAESLESVDEMRKAMGIKTGGEK